jgi:Flp pilus assembly protein TadD
MGRRRTPHKDRTNRASPAPERPPVDADLEAEPLFDVAALANWNVWICAGLVALTAVVYASVRSHGWVGLDDIGYIRDNPHVAAGLTADGIRWAFTTGYAANWHPVTWLSHMLDVQIFGVWPGAHHVVNLVLHITNTLLLFALLLRLTAARGASAFVAALFALHPLHVESVAWLAERKDVLSTLFWLLTTLLYAAWVDRRTWLRYAGVLAMFALGLLAKPMLVTLPVTLLLIDWWPLERLRRASVEGRRATWRSLVIEKIPLFALAAASSVVTVIVQRAGGAVSGFDVLPLAVRLTNALLSYWRYAWKTIWPMDLVAFYPYARTQPVVWGVAAATALAAVTWIAWRVRTRRPYVITGWLWYLVTLLPVAGFLQVGTQSLADRYTYVPLIGLFVIVAWTVRDLVARMPAMRVVAGATAAALVVACVALTRAQAATWHDERSLWEHALAVMPDNYRAHNALGVLAGNAGQTAEALAHLRQVVAAEPSYPEGQHNLGLALASSGDLDQAIAHYRQALRLKPSYAEAHNNLGLALARLGRSDEAVAEYREALRVNPSLAEAHTNLGLELTRQGRAAEAREHFDSAVGL